MKPTLSTIVFLIIGSTLFGQQQFERIKVVLVINGEVCPGATLRVKNTAPLIETTTNENGQAILDLPSGKGNVEITGLIEAKIQLTIERPTDSIYFDIDSKKATFYNNRKKLKTRKQIVRGL